MHMPVGGNMTYFPDPQSLMARVIALLGGIDRAEAVIVGEMNESQRRWDQDILTIGRILRAHLYVEHYLTTYLEEKNPQLGSLTNAHLSFIQKVELLNPENDLLRQMQPGIKHLNAIRNRLAHQLTASVTSEDAIIFLGATAFKVFRDEAARRGPLGTSGLASQDPLDVLEGFAKFSGTVLTGGSGILSMAIGQALSELRESGAV
jgi:hypothetical protein